MKVDFERVSQVIKTLPVGYYIGREVKVELDSSIVSSMYDIANDMIYISFPQVVLAMSKVKGKLADEKTFENIIRSVFYHELSHAMLTPRKLKPTDTLNIFEDERIERVLDDYFQGVDFNKLVNLLNRPCEEDDKSYRNWFFDLVRFRRGPRGFLVRVEEIIDLYKDLDSLSNNWDLIRYKESVNSLYHDYKNYLESQGKIFEDEEGRGEREERSGSADSANGSSVTLINNAPLEGNEKTESNKSQEEGSESDKSQEDNDEGQVIAFNVSPSPCPRNHKTFNVLNQIVDRFIDDKLISEFTRIFNSAKKVRDMRGSAVNSYSGIFDPRSVIRDDYKYFLNRSRNGSARSFSKVHLNLFLDRSGSFSPNETIANQIIYALLKCEKINPDFTFTLITCGCGETIEEKKNILFEADDGNSLDDEIWSIFKKVQKPSSANYNIVLFDGCAAWGAENQNFGAFNDINTCIISDPDNEDAIIRYAPSARRIITKSYTEELKDNLIKLLGTVIR